MTRLILFAAVAAIVLGTLLLSALAPWARATPVGYPVILSRKATPPDCSGDNFWDIVVSVTTSQLWINQEALTVSEFENRVAKKMRTRAVKVIFIRADKDVPIGRLVETIDRIQAQAAGTYLVLVTPVTMHQGCWPFDYAAAERADWHLGKEEKGAAMRPFILPIPQ